MSGPLTPGQRDALAHLVIIRILCKKLVQTRRLIQADMRRIEKLIHDAIKIGDLKAEALAKIDIVQTREAMLEINFKEIEYGQFFISASARCDESQLPRDVWLRALSVNESEWESDYMRQYGQTVLNVVTALGLENSATKDDSIEYKPLKWCATMAMMNATRTNPKMGEFMHNACNEMLGGAFGEWKKPTILQRLGAAH